VEVAAGQRFAGVGEDQRVVGDAVGLGRERRGRLPDEVEHRAHHLRLAAQAIGILHAVVVDQMGGADGAPGHQRAQGGGNLDLAAMAAQRVNARIERRVGALGGVGRERAGDQRRLEHALDREQARQRLRGRELGAVEQREPLLRAERNGREPGAGERGRGRHALARMLRLADPEHGGRQMSEGRQIARRSHRALARDHRNKVTRQHSVEHLDGAHAHAGGAAAEARELQRHHQPHIGRPHRLADPGGVGEHDVALERGEVRGGNVHAGELAEAGVDAINRLAARDDGIDRPRARLDHRRRGGVEPHGRAVCDRAPLHQGRASRRQRDRGGHRPLRTRACSGLKPIR
jgi:hypothetical protein